MSQPAGGSWHGSLGTGAKAFAVRPVPVRPRAGGSWPWALETSILNILGTETGCPVKASCSQPFLYGTFTKKSHFPQQRVSREKEAIS